MSTIAKAEPFVCDIRIGGRALFVSVAVDGRPSLVVGECEDAGPAVVADIGDLVQAMARLA